MSPTFPSLTCSVRPSARSWSIGATSIDLERVQVHPMGLVKLDDPDTKIRFLAAEVLRGVGGLVGPGGVPTRRSQCLRMAA